MLNQGYAKNELPATKDEPPVCDNLTVFMTSSRFGLEVKASWKVEGNFPNPSKVVNVGDSHGSSSPFSIECPDVSIDYDGNRLRMQGDNLKSVTDRIYTSVTTGGIDFFRSTWYEYPHLRMGLKSDYYGLNLKTLRIYNGISQLKDRNSFESRHPSKSHYKVVIGYKVDGGALKPLVYEGKVRSYVKEFSKAQTIDIFHKNPEALSKGKGVERLFIDKNNGVLEVYKNYDFPEK